MSFDVVMIKSFSSSSKPALEKPAEKKYVSAVTGKPLSEESAEKAKKLGETLQKFGPFAGIHSSESKTSYDTAHYATGAEVIVNKGFNQIRLGTFEGVQAEQIQQAYAEAHPTARFIPEPNDCLNKPWPNGADFETYEEVDARVLEAFSKLHISKEEKPVYVVSAPKEPVRSVMLHATVAESARNSQFYQQLAVHLQREPTLDETIRQFAVRGQLNPKDGSWIRFHYENGKISIVDVSADVEFRKAPPVPGYIRE